MLLAKSWGGLWPPPQPPQELPPVYMYKTEKKAKKLVIGERARRYLVMFMELEIYIREYGSTLYVGLARAVSPTNTNFRLSFLLTRLQEALYEDLAV